MSRSGTLTYEAVKQTSDYGFGQSTCIGIGGDPIPGMSFVDCADAVRGRPADRGHPHGRRDRRHAPRRKPPNTSSDNVSKPVVAYIAGVTAPKGKRMGHAGAIIAGGKGTADGKIRRAGSGRCPTVRSPAELGKGIAGVTGW